MATRITWFLIGAVTASIVWLAILQGGVDALLLSIMGGG